MTVPDSIPGLGAGQRVILFDSVCVLCSAWANFLIRHDRVLRYQLASVQSAEGQALLRWCGLPTDTFDTLVYLEDGCAYYRSDAILRVLAGLGLPWSLTGVFRVIPEFLRDWAYGHIARNRYRLFGRHAYCVMPGADHGDRFLSHRSVRGVESGGDQNPGSAAPG
ncbi:MAG: thiol-disulfide oxidoreductase DCC family protein [Xanthomonadales bacterium]|jgi:predicted DCC family thiol-disulfide oxidoreductase YuxK|nr:thiol-disulfide oxidoreductase DCC family protein [Xanthomonadales bacterium]